MTYHPTINSLRVDTDAFWARGCLIFDSSGGSSSGLLFNILPFIPCRLKAVPSRRTFSSKKTDSINIKKGDNIANTAILAFFSIVWLALSFWRAVEN